MRPATLVPIIFISSTLAHTPWPLVSHPVSPLHRRTDTGTTYLPNIISLITTGCTATCSLLDASVSNCVGTAGADDEAIATCSCGAAVLGPVQLCATCIVADPATTTGTQALLQYNGFVAQCVSVNLANASMLASIPPSTASQTLEAILASSAPTYPLSSLVEAGSASLVAVVVASTEAATASVDDVQPTSGAKAAAQATSAGQRTRRWMAVVGGVGAGAAVWLA